MHIKQSLAACLHSLLAKRHGGLLLFLAVYLTLSFATRVALLCQSFADVAWNASLLAASGWGLLFDLATAAWISLPLTVILTLLPATFLHSKIGHVLTALVSLAALFALLFGTAAEWFFWEEFNTRFNFIAVDYLVYTTEVLGNIRESYPLPAIIAGLLAASALLLWLLWQTGLPKVWLTSEHEPFRARLRNGAGWLTAARHGGTAGHAAILCQQLQP